MQTLPLPLTLELKVEYTPYSQEYKFEQSPVSENIAKGLRPYPVKSLEVSTYLPVTLFQVLDDFMMGYDGKPVLWNNQAWLIENYECEYLGRGDCGNVKIQLSSINN